MEKTYWSMSPKIVSGSIHTSGKFNYLLSTKTNVATYKARTPGFIDPFTCYGGIAQLIGSNVETTSLGKIFFRDSLWMFPDGTYVCLEVDTGQVCYYSFTDGSNELEKLDKLWNYTKLMVKPYIDTDVDKIRIKFWNHSADGPAFKSRDLTVSSWEEIKNNYAKEARESLESLMYLKPEDIRSGKILLIHGPPGTGKTTAIRSLVKAWEDWCESEYIVDPESFFGISSYLTGVTLENESNLIKESTKRKYRLLIVEDAEEFLNAEKNLTQSVARLLNFGDGLLGQGLRTLILMTTNVPVHELHPAVTRPGRCLANIHVPRFSKVEATEWLGSPHEEASLAELFEARSETQQVGNGIPKVDYSSGTYL